MKNNSKVILISVAICISGVVIAFILQPSRQNAGKTPGDKQQNNYKPVNPNNKQQENVHPQEKPTEDNQIELDMLIQSAHSTIPEERD